MIEKYSKDLYLLGKSKIVCKENEIFFNIIKIDESKTFLYFGSCHSMKNNEILKVCSYIRGFLDNIAHFSNSLSLIANTINIKLKNIIKNNSYVSLFIAIIDSSINKMKYLNCGHEFPVLIKKESISELCSGESILGLFDDLIFCEEEIDFLVEDKLFLFNKNIFLLHNGHINLTRNKIKSISDNLKHFYKKKFMSVFINELKNFYFSNDINRNFALMVLGYNNYIEKNENIVEFKIVSSDEFRKTVLKTIKSISNNRCFSEKMVSDILWSFNKIFDNVNKHAYNENENNKYLDINIKYTNEMLKFSIKDHGKGINKEEIFNELKSGNSSLKKIRDRVNEFIISGKPKYGTEVTVKIKEENGKH